MDEQSVPPTRPEAKGLTLADISVTWAERAGITRTITGRQIAQLITAAAHDIPADAQIGNFEAGMVGYRLRGLSALVFPDAGPSIYESDSRAFVADVLQQWAAEIEADALDSDDWPRQFRVEMAKPKGAA